MNHLRILIVDDEEGIRHDLEEFFVEYGYTVFTAGLPSQAFAVLEQHEIDIVILDMKLPEMNGLEVLKRIKATFPDIEVIMITGYGETRSIVEAMRSGAFDFFTKPFSMLEVRNAIERTNKFLALQHKLKTIAFNYTLVLKELQTTLHHPVIGESRMIRTVLELMSKVAQTDDTAVLITGESGTGKELVARGIHYLSQRKDRYFCEVNCSAIPDSLFESEFFGHRKGSFTGALNDQPGYFEAAHQGTLFLDEIGDIPLPYQTKLLRAIEQKTVKRLGSQKAIPVDVRIISATNRDLQPMVNEQRFRLDLLHRINTFVIHLTPLRERPDDIPPLLEYFTRYFSQKLRKPISGIDKQAINALRRYHFAGNVRELRNLVERAVILCDDTRLQLQHFCFFPEHTQETPLKAEAEESLNLDQLTAQSIVKALKRASNKAEAAQLLGISRQALDRKMQKYNLG